MTVVIGEAGELGLNSEAVCAFYENSWKRQIALADPRFYRWQFTGSPSDGGVDHCMVAADDKTRAIVGVMGLNRRPFFLNGEKKDGAELTTWTVSEDLVGRGVGPRILAEIQSRYDVLIGMGISAPALPVYMRMGFRFIRAIERYVKVFDFEAVKKHARSEPLAGKLVKEWSSLGAMPFDVQPAGADAIRPLGSLLQDRFNHFQRDWSHLQWRYAEHPAFEYKQFVVRSKTAPGKGVYVCIREERAVEGLRLVHVLDCVGDTHDMTAAASFIHSYCAERAIHLADFYCTSSEIGRFFTASGWFSTNNDLCFRFPHLFHPIEFRDPPTTSLIYWSRSGFADLADLSRLYVTKQDADLDRPVPLAA